VQSASYWSPSPWRGDQSGQDELAVIKAARASKISLVVEDLQSPDTILGWGPSRDCPLTRLAWTELEQLLLSQDSGMPEAVSPFLARLTTEKWRLHLLWKRSVLINQATTQGGLLKAIVVPLDALLYGTICWIEIAV